MGCGACRVACPSGIDMRRNTDGYMEAIVTDQQAAAARPSGICPFSDATTNESDLAAELFPQAGATDGKLGRFDATFAGHVIEEGHRARGSSGGMTSWMAEQLLVRDLVDAVVHVHPADPMTSSSSPLFSYDVARSPQEVRTGAKTRYYSVDFADALLEVIEKGDRIALIGVPCFIKAARHLAASDPAFGACMTYGIALICGHMKSAGFAESLAWQSGIRPTALRAVDFRKKLPGRPATRYGFEAASQKNRDIVTKPMSDLVGRNWDGGYFKLKACEFCDDVVGECADIAFGDAWLQRYTKDHQGTNVVIVRNPVMQDILTQAQQAGTIALDPLTPDEAIMTQSAGFRDRREGLQYRLALADGAGRWRPQKRVSASSDHLNPVRKTTIRLRDWIRRRSFASYALSKRCRTIRIYQIEMSFYHAGLKLLSVLERKLYRAK